MATSSIQVNVIDVGQGQCTFVEVYDVNIKIVQTLLFDCGSNSKHTRDGVVDKNLDYIAKQVCKMTSPAFSCIFFSHGDTDHTNLTAKLLAKINVLLEGTDKTLAVGSVWYGGARSDYYKNSSNILDTLANHYCASKTDVKGTNANYTSYNRSSKEFNTNLFLWKSPDEEVIVYAIATNALSNNPDFDEESDDEIPAGKDAEEKNRVSLVCALYYKRASYVICGDATNNTMAMINNLFAEGTSVFNNNHMTTLPHHGSRATGLAVPSGDPANEIHTKVVKTFSKSMNSQTITVSAYKRHSHPSLELMSYFPPVTKNPVIYDYRFSDDKTHLLSAYIDNGIKKTDGIKIPEKYATFTSRSNMFSTTYSFGTIGFSYQIGAKSEIVGSPIDTSPSSGAINPFACWQYNVTSSGYVLRGFPSLDTGSSAFTFPSSFLHRSKEQENILPKKVLKKNVQQPIQVRKKSTKKQQPIILKSRISNRIRRVA